MPEVEITRKQIIVVGEIKGIVGDQYPKWVFTDKEGNEYKIRPDRTKHFECVVPGNAVQINWTSFHGNEYPYNATAVKDKLPTAPPSDTRVAAIEAEQTAKAKPPQVETTMTKSDWSEKDRITRKSIERQTALKEANLRVPAGESSAKVVATAKLFEAYLEGNELVEEAKRLIKKGGEPLPSSSVHDFGGEVIP